MSASKEDPAVQLREKVEQHEKNSGQQVCWASTPKEAAPARRKEILFHAVISGRRQYAFATEEDREQFVYDRADTLFSVSREVRAQLGLSPPNTGGTVVGPWSSFWSAPTRKTRQTTASAPEPVELAAVKTPPVEKQQALTTEPKAGKSRFRK